MTRGLKIGAWIGGALALILAIALAAATAWPPKAPPVFPGRAFVAAPPPPSLLTPGTRCQPPALTRRVFVDVNADFPPQVFRKLAQSLGCGLSLDPEVRAPVTLRVFNVTAETALNAVCDSVGCRWRIDGAQLRVEFSAPPPRIPSAEVFRERTRKPLPASFKFDHMALGDVAQAVSRETGIEIRFEQVDLSTPITVDLGDERVFDAINRILGALNWTSPPTFNVESRGDLCLIRIGRRG